MSKSQFDHVCQSVALFIRYIFPYELNLGCRYIFLMLLYSSDLKIRAFSENLGHAGMYTTYFFILQSSLSAQQKKKSLCWNEKAEKRAQWVYC